MEIGPVNGLVLIGGGEILLELSNWAKEINLDVLVITSPRQCEESIRSGTTLRSLLHEEAIVFLEIDDIESPEVNEYLSGKDNWLFLSLGAAWIFNKGTIENTFRDQLLNVHGTRLPTNRGAGGFSWQIMMGNRIGCCLVHKVDSGVDTGPIVAYEEFLYPNHCRTPMDFEQVYKKKTILFLKSFIENSIRTSVTLQEIFQLDYLSTYWPRLNTNLNGWINWNWSAEEIERYILAFDDPYKGAQTFVNNKKVRLKGVCLSSSEAAFHSYQSGLVYRVADEWICVAVTGSSLIVQNVLDENGKSMLAHIKPGDRFFTPYKYLEDSFARVVYTPLGVRTK